MCDSMFKTVIFFGVQRINATMWSPNNTTVLYPQVTTLVSVHIYHKQIQQSCIRITFKQHHVVLFGDHMVAFMRCTPKKITVLNINALMQGITKWKHSSERTLYHDVLDVKEVLHIVC